MRVLVTGAAGFIGFHVSAALLARGDEVVGLDNVNSYYDPALKERRLEGLSASDRFEFFRADLRDIDAIDRAFAASPDRVVHLAAQAGVRHSLTHPHDYAESNITGTLNVLEACRHHGTEHLVYASSSSVYGANTSMPFSVHHNVDHPMSLYAASKKSNELMAHAYSNLFAIPTTGLRFFTVYGPWGRPDMALFLFTSAILEGRPIDVYNEGNMARDFTYIDDIVEGVVRVLDRPPAPDPTWTGTAPDPATSFAPVPRLQHREQPAGGASRVHRRDRTRDSGGAPRSTCSRCSRATSSSRGPMSTIWSATSTSRRTHRSKSGSNASSTGTASTTSSISRPLRRATPRARGARAANRRCRRPSSCS